MRCSVKFWVFVLVIRTCGFLKADGIFVIPSGLFEAQ